MGLLLLLAGDAILPLFYGAHPLVKVLDCVCVFTLSFWAAGLSCWRARHEGPAAFYLLGLGAALGGLHYAPTLLPFPYASITGPGVSILGLLVLGAGFLIWPQRIRLARDRARTTLDGLIIALSFFALAWVATSSMTGVVRIPRGQMLVYVIQISICLGLLALWLLQETRLRLPEQAGAKRLVRAALTVLLCHSSLAVLLHVLGRYEQSYFGHAVEVLHQVANALLALAAISPASATGAEPAHQASPPLRALIPSIATLLALVVVAPVVFQPHQEAPRVLMALSFALLGVFLLRQALLIFGLEAFSQNLEARVEERTQRLSVLHQEALVNLRMRMMAGLAAGLAHDLNNVLNVIHLRLQLLQETVTPDQLEDVTVLKRASERAISLAGRILSSGRLQDVTPVPVELGEWLHQRTDMLKALLRAGQTLEVQVDPDLHFLADPQSLEQILENLISNARDAMGPSGSVQIIARAGLDTVRIEVRDTGPGIPEEHLVRLFEPFFSTKAQGMGLGLATVRSLVLQNKGTIQVEGGPGKGTAFLIELPIPTEAPC
jgi:signal transduction histidine kinase